jgi:hypothetical protein
MSSSKKHKTAIDSAVIFNLSSLPIITEYIEHDLNAFRQTFEQTKIVTFDYDVWASTSNDVNYVNCQDNMTIRDAIVQLDLLIDWTWRESEMIVFGSTVTEAFEKIIPECLEKSTVNTTFKELIDIARASEHWYEQLEYTLGVVVPSHVTFWYWRKFTYSAPSHKPLLRVLNDSAEIPMNWLETDTVYIVDSHAQKLTKWGKPVEYFPVVHHSTKAFASKYADIVSNPRLRQKNQFAFGMSNYTGSEDTERSRIEHQMHRLTAMNPDAKFYVSGNVYGIRTKIPYEQYLEEVAKSSATMIIPSYDVNAFSVRRISEAIHLKTVLLFWSTEDLRRLFKDTIYEDFLRVYEKWGLILHEQTAEAIQRALGGIEQWHDAIIYDLEQTSIFKEWYDEKWYKYQMTNILNRKNAKE